MRQPHRLSLYVAAAFVLAGCQASPAPPVPVALQAAAPAGEYRVTPSFRDGAVRRLMAQLTPYTQASIDHMVVRLIIVAAGPTETEVESVDVSAANLAKTITFGNLKHNTTYRIRAHAYKAPGTAAADLISDDAESFVDMPVLTDDEPALGNLEVTLIDQTFAGEATSPALTVTDGAIVHSGSETVVLNP